MSAQVRAYLNGEKWAFLNDFGQCFNTFVIWHH